MEHKTTCPSQLIKLSKNPKETFDLVWKSVTKKIPDSTSPGKTLPQSKERKEGCLWLLTNGHKNLVWNIVFVHGMKSCDG